MLISGVTRQSVWLSFSIKRFKILAQTKEPDRSGAIYTSNSRVVIRKITLLSLWRVQHNFVLFICAEYSITVFIYVNGLLIENRISSIKEHTESVK